MKLKYRLNRLKYRQEVFIRKIYLHSTLLLSPPNSNKYLEWNKFKGKFTYCKKMTVITNGNKFYHFPTMNELNDLLLDDTLIVYLRNEIGKLTKSGVRLLRG